VLDPRLEMDDLMFLTDPLVGDMQCIKLVELLGEAGDQPVNQSPFRSAWVRYRKSDQELVAVGVIAASKSSGFEP
jgi:hypothetical protein